MNACFLQGTEVQKVFVNDEQLIMFDGISPGSLVTAEFEIRVGQKTYISIISVNPAVTIISDTDTNTAELPGNMDAKKVKSA